MVLIDWASSEYTVPPWKNAQHVFIFGSSLSYVAIFFLNCEQCHPESVYSLVRGYKNSLRKLRRVPLSRNPALYRSRYDHKWAGLDFSKTWTIENSSLQIYRRLREQKGVKFTYSHDLQARLLFPWIFSSQKTNKPKDNVSKIRIKIMA